MIDIGTAQRQVLDEIQLMGTERVHILDALGRTLARDMQAKMDVPLGDNSSMDGFACKSEDVAGATSCNPATLTVIGESAAGRPFTGIINRGEAVQIMTGALIPRGADMVIKVEDTRLEGDHVTCFVNPGKGSYIRLQGEDVKAGATTLKRGQLVKPAHVGMMATMGYAHAYVFQRPTVAVLSTGNELVDLNEPLCQGKVISSNTYSLAAQILDCGAVPLSLGIAGDSAQDQIQKLRMGLKADAIVTSGGVSVGKYDMVKGALLELGMSLKFWKVAMRPGKPLVFGTIDSKPIFGLPGNPTSAMVSFELFTRPALLKMMGRENIFRPTIECRLAEEIPSEPGRLHLIRCKLTHQDGEIIASSTGTQSSGVLSSMTMADGLIILPPVREGFPKGFRVKVLLLNSDGAMTPESVFWSNKLLPSDQCDQGLKFEIEYFHEKMAAQARISAVSGRH